MIKKILKFLMYIIVFILALFSFLPKEELYNLAQKELLKEKLIISEEKVFANINSLVLKDAILYYKGINIAKIKEFEINTVIYDSNVKINNVILLESLKQMFPGKINFIKLNYNLLNYNIVSIDGKGEFGIINGTVDLNKRKIKIKLKASSKMKRSYSMILRKMSFQNGGYIYEYRF